MPCVEQHSVCDFGLVSTISCVWYLHSVAATQQQTDFVLIQSSQLPGTTLGPPIDAGKAPPLNIGARILT